MPPGLVLKAWWVVEWWELIADDVLAGSFVEMERYLHVEQLFKVFLNSV